MTRLTLVVLALFAVASHGQRPTLKEYEEGQANASKAAAAVAAKGAKMAAVDKVISMVEDLMKQVMTEGTAEAKTYDEFACFCKTTQKAKSEAITQGDDDKTELTSSINDYTAKRDELDETIKQTVEDIDLLAKYMKGNTTQRAADKAEYDKNAADMAGAIYGLENAISALKASKTNASDTVQVKLLQIQSVSKTVRSALQLADAMGLIQKKNKALGMFLQSEPFPDSPASVEMQDYKFHSGDIITTLEGLLKDFKTDKDAIDAAEVKSIQDYDMTMQDLTDMTTAKKKVLAQAKKDKEEKMEEIATASQELSIVSSTLLDDQQYLSDLNVMCSEKAQTWDQRNKVRSNELQTLATVLPILKNTVGNMTTAQTVRLVQQGQANVIYGSVVAKDIARNPSTMEALEAIAESEESGTVGFLQHRQVHKHKNAQPRDDVTMLQDQARDAVARMLKSSKYKSTLLTGLASRIETGADPFAKIKFLIQEMIEKLLAEESSEANKKGSCDKQLSAESDKRDRAAAAVESLDTELAGLQATFNKMNEKKQNLEDELAELAEELANATQTRNNDHADNLKAIADAKAGLAGIDEAILILDRFYKTVAKATIELSLAQGPADDAPGTTFKIGEAYTGAQAESGGIIGMMDVIKSDFERTISDAKKAEAEQAAAFLKFSTENGKSTVKKQEALDQVNKLVNEVDAEIMKKNSDLTTEMSTLQTAIKMLIELKAECIDTGMSYEERVDRRADEISDLKKALCILNNYEDYGTDGDGGSC